MHLRLFGHVLTLLRIHSKLYAVDEPEVRKSPHQSQHCHPGNSRRFKKKHKICKD